MAAKWKRTWDGTERRDDPSVLVASQRADANELLRRVLDGRRFRTLTATTPDEATGVVADHLPRAAVLDLSSEGVGASMQVLDAIRQHDDPKVRGCRVVIVARATSNRTYAFQSGADGFLLRPYHVNDLLGVLAQVLSIAPEDRAKHRRDMLNLPASQH